MAEDLTSVLNKLQNQFGSLSGIAGTTGARQQGLGGDALSQMLQQFTKMSQGSSGQLMASLPEAQTVMSQYDAARNSLANLAPRGGMRASQGANLKFGELGQLGGLVQGARQGAAGAAEQTAGALTEAGTGEQAIAENYVKSVMESQLERRKQNKDTIGSQFTGALGKGLGEGIAGLLI
jgi:hypothetical protein